MGAIEFLRGGGHEHYPLRFSNTILPKMLKKYMQVYLHKHLTPNLMFQCGLEVAPDIPSSEWICCMISQKLNQRWMGATWSYHAIAIAIFTTSSPRRLRSIFHIQSWQDCSDSWGWFPKYSIRTHLQTNICHPGPLEFAACRSGLEVCFQFNLGLRGCREASLKWW